MILYFVFMYSTYLASTSKKLLPHYDVERNFGYTGTTVLHFKIILAHSFEEFFMLFLGSDFLMNRNS
jgi:hypothetical protein